MVGDEEVLEESGGSGGGPAGAVIPGGWRAGWAGSVRQPASLGGVGTGGTVTSFADCGKKKEIVLIDRHIYNIDESILLIISFLGGFHCEQKAPS